MSNANEPDQVNTGALATTGAIVACTALGIALFVTSLVRDETATLGDARQGTQERGVRDLRADQLGVLEAAPTWKDRATGIVTLPIDRAMDWMLESVRKDPKALSPWHPPAPADAMGGAAPQGSDATTGTGGAASGPAAPTTPEAAAVPAVAPPVTEPPTASAKKPAPTSPGPVAPNPAPAP